MIAKKANQPRFNQYEKVRLRADPSVGGIILEVLPHGPGGQQYQVFFSQDDQPFVAETDLLPHSQTVLGKHVIDYRNRADDLRREILLAKLRSSHGESLYSLRASRIEFQVYQFKPVLKFLRNPEQRLLIADEVGLGKTIEAGIIMTELQARLELDRVLVVCPAPLRAKWQDEMESRFDEDFQVMDVQALRRFFRDYRRHGEFTPLRGIISIELLRREEFIAQFAEDQVHFDLVVIDEAHHCRNPETNTNALATVLGDNADAMLLLTATPLNLGNQDLFHLLQILSPGEFDDLALFEERINPNRYINAAARLIEKRMPRQALARLQQVEGTTEYTRFTKHPYYAEVKTLLDCDTLPRERALQAQRLLLELNTLAHIFTRTRKREVVRNAPLRDVHLVQFSFEQKEKAFYDAVIHFVRQHWYVTAQESWSVGFALVMRERQAASCIRAFSEQYVERMTRLYLDPEDLDMAEGLVADGEDPNGLRFPKVVQEAAEQLSRLAKSLGPTDTKFDVFLTVLRDALSSEPEAKILLFSYFRATLEYLRQRLSRAGIPAALIHGGVPVRRRNEIIEDFRSSPHVRVLLSSEVGSEGIDLQFSHILFNYDLPWNPMKVEQRIGRIDRFGQHNPKITIYNFVAKDTVEDRIYARLYQRIRIFEESIGDLEAILGQAMRDLTRELYRKELTPEEELELADRAANTVLREQHDQLEFEKHRLEFMGQDAILQEIEEATQSGRYVSPEELLALVHSYLQSEFPDVILERNPEDETWCLHPTQQFAQSMKKFLGARQAQLPYSDLLQRLQRQKPVPITFFDQVAYERKLVEFVTLRHPLARMARAYWQQKADGDCPVLTVHVRARVPSGGRFYFFVFALHTQAARPIEKLVPVVISADTWSIRPVVGEHFLRIVQEAEEVHAGQMEEIREDELQKARDLALWYMRQLRATTHDNTRRLNDALVSARLDAQKRTYDAKIRRVRGYLAKVTESRIRRMREAQLRNLEINYEAERAELKKRRDVRTTFSLRLAGVMLLESSSVQSKKQD